MSCLFLHLVIDLKCHIHEILLLLFKQLFKNVNTILTLGARPTVGRISSTDRSLLILVLRYITYP